MPVINRHIINPDINYDGANRDDLFRLINRWKRLLLFKYHVRKGNVMALGIFDVTINHIACLFAAAELGLKIFIITKPLARETIHATKMGIFGPVDITVSQKLEPGDLHIEMFSRYSKQICQEDEIEEITDDTDIEIPVHSSEALIFASTSGTTGNSKPVFFTHDEVYRISQRNITVFGYNKNSIVQQTVNMHHASAMLTYLFPTLMACDTHYVGNIAFGPHLQTRIWYPNEFIEVCLADRKVDNLICSNKFFLEIMLFGLERANRFPEHRITMNMSGFPATQDIYDMAKKYPIDFISHYGSIDTGIPLLVNKITQDSVYEPGYIGVLADDFYKIEDNLVYSDLWSEPREVPDRLMVENGKFYYLGRKAEQELYVGEIRESIQDQFGDHDFVISNTGKQYVVLWDKDIEYDIKNSNSHVDKLFTFVYLNKRDFMVDTKVSMEQLRAYLEHNYAV